MNRARLVVGGIVLAAGFWISTGSSAQIVLRGAVLGTGGSDASAGDVRARATLGQAAAGFAAGGEYDARIGFWYLLTPTIPTGVEEYEDAPPAVFRLEKNRPNPFNPTTTIPFSIAKEGRVSLKVYDLSGREVATLVDRELPAGSHEVVLRADRLASGVYFYRLRSGREEGTGRMVLIR
ncbi:MAG: T9SS type A sorting domain-containing protein [Candidatus Eisenbacteria bacterium]